MQYAREVMDLLGAFPGRNFRMAAIVRYTAGENTDQRKRKAVRAAVRRVLLALIESGAVEVSGQDKRGGFALYRWKTQKVLHEEVELCRA